MTLIHTAASECSFTPARRCNTVSAARSPGSKAPSATSGKPPRLRRSRDLAINADTTALFYKALSNKVQKLSNRASSEIDLPDVAGGSLDPGERAAETVLQRRRGETAFASGCTTPRTG